MGDPSDSSHVQDRIHDLRLDLQRVHPDGIVGNLVCGWLWPAKFFGDPLLHAAVSVVPLLTAKIPLADEMVGLGCTVVSQFTHAAFGLASTKALRLVSSSEDPSSPVDFLLERLFPDKKYDGMFQNPDSEELFDFDQVMKQENPLQCISDMSYYPNEAVRKRGNPFVFISGLGQKAAEASIRSRRYAERLNVGILNLNNSTFLKENPILKQLNPRLDWIDATLDRIGISGSPCIENASRLITHAVDQQTKINIAADSHGTIFLARALGRARRRFLRREGKKEGVWLARAKSYVNIVTFGNGHSIWPNGPNYCMVYIEGDVLPAKFGTTVERAKQQSRTDLNFVKFDPFLEGYGLEAHNMMFTIELLRQTFIKNSVDIGDTSSLLQKLQAGRFDLATPAEVDWPHDMHEYVWDPASLEAIKQNTPRQDKD